LFNDLFFANSAIIALGVVVVFLSFKLIGKIKEIKVRDDLIAAFRENNEEKDLLIESLKKN